MFKLHQFILIIFISLIESYTFAGSMGHQCDIQDVTISCNLDSWGIEGHGLYLQPVTDLGKHQNIETERGQVRLGVEPRWTLGFEVGATYLFNSGKDFVWSWDNYRNINNRYELPNSTFLSTILLAPVGSVTSDTNLTNVRLSHYDNQLTVAWDQINLGLGQYINLPHDFKIRPHIDLEITRVAHYMLTNVAASDNTNGDYRYSTNFSSMFNGAGPRTGFDLKWSSDIGLELYGSGAIGLIAGPSKTNYTVVNILNSRSTNYNLSNINIVPSLDSRLGGRYQFDMTEGVINVDIGWMWFNYINSLDIARNTNINSVVHQYSFGIQGLYFGLQWFGTIA